MVTVRIKNWNDGLDKVSLSKLQMQLLSIPLKDAKQNVDDLLIGKEVLIKNVRKEDAVEFIEKALQIGLAECEIIK
jgi:hypothetical protein